MLVNGFEKILLCCTKNDAIWGDKRCTISSFGLGAELHRLDFDEVDDLVQHTIDGRGVLVNHDAIDLLQLEDLQGVPDLLWVSNWAAH